MVQKLLMVALEQLFKRLDAEMVKEFIDAGLDKLEDKYIVGEVDTLQEKGVSGLIKLIRDLFGIDDKKYGTDKQ